MTIKQKPLYDRVIVKRLEEESASKLIVQGLSKEKPMRAEVIAVGCGYRDKEGMDPHPLLVKVGDIVLIGKYAGAIYEQTDPKTFKTEEYVIIREEDILTVFMPEKEKK